MDEFVALWLARWRMKDAGARVLAESVYSLGWRRWRRWQIISRNGSGFIWREGLRWYCNLINWTP